MTYREFTYKFDEMAIFISQTTINDNPMFSNVISPDQELNYGD